MASVDRPLLPLITQPTHRGETILSYIDKIVLGTRLTDESKIKEDLDTVGTDEQHVRIALALEKKKICTVDRSLIPAPLLFEPKSNSLANLLYGTIKGFDSTNTPTAQTVNDALEQFTRQAKGRSGSTRDRVIILAPTTFGDEVLSISNIKAISSFSKSIGDLPNIESRLRFLNQLHLSENEKFTEATLLQNLHLIVPKGIQERVSCWVQNKMSLQYVFDKLMLNLSQSLTIAQLREEFLKLDTAAILGNRKPYDLLLDLEKLSDKTIGDVTQIDDLCVEQAYRVLRSSTNDFTCQFIRNCVATSGGQRFIDLLQVVKDNFTITLDQQWKQHAKEVSPRRTHNVERSHNVENSAQRAPKNFESRHYNQGGNGGDNRQPARPTSYRDAPCHRHNGHHANIMCMAKRSPCALNGHRGHLYRECATNTHKRKGMIREQFPDGPPRYTPPAPVFNNNVDRTPPPRYNNGAPGPRNGPNRPFDRNFTFRGDRR
ncbi:MAG: hypothetical protein EXS59_02630 [Candidatus Taylorbacteria bacterium]|nr:hypothetical protein [Candidatus Taylorbacteria bacterium]